MVSKLKVVMFGLCLASLLAGQPLKQGKVATTIGAPISIDIAGVTGKQTVVDCVSISAVVISPINAVSAIAFINDESAKETIWQVLIGIPASASIGTSYTHSICGLGLAGNGNMSVKILNSVPNLETSLAVAYYHQ